MGLRSVLKKKIYNLKYLKVKKNDIKEKLFLITGASSGIGLALTNKLAENNKIIAVYNSNNSNLEKINSNNIIKVKCDLSNFLDYGELTEVLAKHKIDIIINCAGQFGSNNQLIENIDFDSLIKIFKINSISLLKILQLLSKNDGLKCINKIINISSDAGSIKLNNQGNAYVYRITKTSLNCISKNLSIDLNKRYNSEIITVDPGNVQTGMNTKGLLDPNKCAEYIIDIICDKKNNLNGKFIDLFKKEIPW
jgi:short-subunit dehydrogenase|tara:strand:+ start:274 stop:1026 length:753 start_codon:yes stop_codon:yes gene_type:complete